MQFERLIIDAGGQSFTIDFHDRLTVVAGVGRLEREGLVNELIGALGSSRSGVHLEMVSDAGNRFAIFRPEGAHHRVVDIDTASDVSGLFAGPDGTIDLLARAGLDTREAKRRMRITPDDVHTTSETERYVAALAQVDQGRLWELAERVLEHEHRLDEEADASGFAPEDAEAVQRIEELHRAAEQLALQHDRIRGWTLWGSFASTLVAMLIALTRGALFAFPFIAAAVAAVVVSIYHYRRLSAAQAAEEDALAAVGANSYLSFHLHRVNALLRSDQGRKRLMSAAQEHRAVLAQWKLLAGDITVQWAVEHRDQIKAAALEHRRSQQVGRVAKATPEVTSQVVQDVTAVLLRKLSELATMGPGGESFPVILDDPFAELPEGAKPSLLEAVARASSQQQIVYLTEDPDVAAWARLEAITGALSIIEPAAAAEEASPPRESRPAVV